jgi:phosphatidylglycerophosphatase A
MRNNPFSSLLVKSICTFFFIGYLPLIPGTFGSLAGVGLFFLFHGGSSLGYFLLILCLAFLGMAASGKMERMLGRKDPGCIVIDEVVGMLIALSFLPPDAKTVFLAFLMFRIFDTLKPFPADRLQNLHGAAGIMGDDLVAGVYSNIVLQLVLKLNLSNIV